MKKKSKQEETRLSYVLAGLVLGFFMGAGIVYWSSNSQNGSIFFQKGINYLMALLDGEDDFSFDNHTIILMTDSEKSIVTKTDIAINHPENDSELRKVISEKTAQITTGPEIISGDEEKYFRMEFPGEGQQDFFTDFYPDEIFVLKDSLLQIRTFTVQQPSDDSPYKESIRILDSLLGNSQRSALINIEFWLSPTKYTGYKKTKNRIIIYGFENPGLAKILADNTSLLLEYNNNIFRLFDNETFQPLVQINDTTFQE